MPKPQTEKGTYTPANQDSLLPGERYIYSASDASAAVFITVISYPGQTAWAAGKNVKLTESDGATPITGPLWSTSTSNGEVQTTFQPFDVVLTSGGKKVTVPFTVPSFS